MHAGLQVRPEIEVDALLLLRARKTPRELRRARPVRGAAASVEQPRLAERERARVQDWIVRNPDRRPTLLELADIAGMSSRTLTRTFRRATGISVQEFSTRVRLELAKSLMHEPSLTMEAVAARSGLSARELRRLGVRRKRLSS